MHTLERERGMEEDEKGRKRKRERKREGVGVGGREREGGRELGGSKLKKRELVEDYYIAYCYHFAGD